MIIWHHVKIEFAPHGSSDREHLYALVSEERYRQLIAGAGEEANPDEVVISIYAQDTPHGEVSPRTLRLDTITEVLPWEPPDECGIARAWPESLPMHTEIVYRPPGAPMVVLRARLDPVVFETILCDTVHPHADIIDVTIPCSFPASQITLRPLTGPKGSGKSNRALLPVAEADLQQGRRRGDS